MKNGYDCHPVQNLARKKDLTNLSRYSLCAASSTLSPVWTSPVGISHGIHILCPLHWQVVEIPHVNCKSGEEKKK
jgi:hypothetical protein